MPLVEETGLPDYQAMSNAEGYDMYFGKQISCTNEATDGTGEGPFITYDSQSGYYYLFITYGGLAALDGYNIREYRSENPDGPYLDLAGNDAKDMVNTGAKIIGNYQFSTDQQAYLSAGHSSCLVDDDGKVYQAYHQRYNDGDGGYHNVQIHQMLRTANGWLTMLPIAYNGETASAVSYEDIAGEYEMVFFTNDTKSTDDWSKVDDIIEPTVTATIDNQGNLAVNSTQGTITLDENSYTFTLVLDGTTYYGTACISTKDGRNVITLSALSDDNTTLWAVGE
jgi:arabinan endo-1,5-alpha-L-arabinosidase